MRWQSLIGGAIGYRLLCEVAPLLESLFSSSRSIFLRPRVFLVSVRRDADMKPS